jgi:hypothetical protein
MNSIETRLKELEIDYKKIYNKFFSDSESTAVFEIIKDDFLVDLHVFGGRKKKENFNINEIFYSKGKLKITNKAETGLKNKKVEVTNWTKPFETILKIIEFREKYKFEIEEEKYYNLLKYTKITFENGNYILDEKNKEKIENEIDLIKDIAINNEEEVFYDYIRNHCGGDIGSNEEYVTDILRNKEQVTQTFEIPLTEFIPSVESEKEFENFINEASKIEKKVKLENLYNSKENESNVSRLGSSIRLRNTRLRNLSVKMPHIFENIDEINGPRKLRIKLRIKDGYKKSFFFYITKSALPELELNAYLEYIDVRSKGEFERILRKMEIKEIEVNLTLITYFKLLRKNTNGKDIVRILEEELINNARIKIQDEKIKIFGRNFIFSNEEEVRGKIRDLLKENGI